MGDLHYAGNMLPVAKDASQLQILIEATNAFTEQLVLQNVAQKEQIKILQTMEVDIHEMNTFFKDKDGFIKMLDEKLEERSVKYKADMKVELKNNTNKILLAFAGTLAVFTFIVVVVNMVLNNGQ